MYLPKFKTLSVKADLRYTKRTFDKLKQLLN